MLIGSATDDGRSGALVTTLWSQVSGPGVAVVTAPASAVTTVDFPALGTYVLRLTADDGELSATDDVTIDGERRRQYWRRWSKPVRTRRSRCRST